MLRVEETPRTLLLWFSSIRAMTPQRTSGSKTSADRPDRWSRVPSFTDLPSEAPASLRTFLEDRPAEFAAEINTSVSPISKRTIRRSSGWTSPHASYAFTLSHGTVSIALSSGDHHTRLVLATFKFFSRIAAHFANERFRNAHGKRVSSSSVANKYQCNLP